LATEMQSGRRGRAPANGEREMLANPTRFATGYLPRRTRQSRREERA